ncbi:hypothetical protein AABB24_029394 [Solanum stoloniferum]|uniref:Choline transporter-like protein n=1 Tax=Solanum stoloniferum TaxID=62892 RepID=A0ABD2RXR5_9SOLN
MILLLSVIVAQIKRFFSMSDSQFSSLPSSSCDGSGSPSGAAPAPNMVGSSASGDDIRSRQLTSQVSRDWRDVFWMGVFVLHLVLIGVALAVLGFNRFREKDRLKIDRFTKMILENQHGLTEDFWPFYTVAGAVGTVLAWAWLVLLGSSASNMMKLSVHILTTYLAVISVLCFWQKQFFWGVAFAVGAALQFLYVISVIDRLPFTMLVLQRSVKMVCSLPEVMGVSCAFMLIMLSWLVLWSFGVAGVVALSIGDGGRWWLLVVSWYSV